MTEECVVIGCKLRDALQGHCTFETLIDGRHPLACEYGRFARILHEQVSDLGEWKLREYADGLIKATLRGKNGTVEVWGGTHRGEVWFVEKGTKAETMLCEEWGVADGSLREAVDAACAMAGVQPRLAV